MPLENLARFVLLPELRLNYIFSQPGSARYFATKERRVEYCHRCAQPSTIGYDSRVVRLKDSPLRGKSVELVVKKRRLWCKPCKKPFTERLPGVSKGARTTARYRKELWWASQTFCDLKKVTKAYRCSSWLVYKATYEQLELRRRKNLSYPWPKLIGIDEHHFRRHKAYGTAEFASLIVDHKNKRPYEIVLGRSTEELKAALWAKPGRENVTWVTMDLSGSYRNFTKEFFPNAEIVADKFHVVRLLNPVINKRRKEITGDKRTNPIRRLLLCSSLRLSYFQRSALYKWLEGYPELKEIYHFKEALSGFYRIKGFERAVKAFTALTDRMGLSKLKEIRTLRKTLLRWRVEILNYFRTGLTNARVEGFNNKCKIIKTRGYGYRSFQNYRLRVLNG